MNGRGNFDILSDNVCGIAYVPHSFRIRFEYVPHTLPHTLPHTFSLQEALQGPYFWGMARIRPLREKGVPKGLFLAFLENHHKNSGGGEQ
jgi:hypothetical protein